MQDAIATFSFDSKRFFSPRKARRSLAGTGIWLFGGNRPSYGTYTVTMDGLAPINGSSKSANSVFNQFLGAAIGLKPGPHIVVLTNTGSSSIDFDSFTHFFVKIDSMDVIVIVHLCRTVRSTTAPRSSLMRLCL